jgi:two-component system sensor histidine kinase KdpD
MTHRRLLESAWTRLPAPVGAGPLAGTVAITVAATGLAHVLLRPDSIGAAFAVYLVALVLVAYLWGHAASLLAGALSLLGWDLFLESPPWSLAVSDWPVFLDFTAMVAISLVVATLVDRLRDRLARIELLNDAALTLLTVETPDEVSARAEESAARVLGTPWEILPPDAKAEGAIPLTGSAGLMGHLAPRSGADSKLPSRELLLAFAAQVALAMERAHLARKANLAELDAQAERTRSALLAALGHDLRTPLAGMTGAATSLLLADSGLGEEARQEMLRLIGSESSRLTRLVDNLLDFARLDSGSETPRSEWQPVEEVLGSAVSRFEAWHPGVELETRLEDASLLARFDEILVEQVLLNLMENAVRHGPATGPVQLGARKEGDRLLLEVADRGPGIAPLSGEEIFRPFVAGPGSPGSGLGLAVCRSIARIHGGSLEFRPREGGGSLFRLSLPCTEPPSLEGLE